MRLAPILLAMALFSAAIGGATAARAGGYEVEYAFTGGADGSAAQSSLLKFRGKLYGTTVLGAAHGLGAVYAFDPATGGETVVYAFMGGGDGGYPYRGLTNVGGTLYGTTWNGGGSTNCALGCGTIFALDPTTGAERVVYGFKGAGDSSFPNGGLRNVGGMLYGTTAYGGGSAYCGGPGCGTVFSFDPTTGAETLVYAFKGGADGEGQSSSLIDVNGRLYGTTQQGGDGGGYGTVFSLDPMTGAETVVYAFKGGGDGAIPVAGLIKVGGALYGTTEEGGVSCAEISFGCGTMFSLDLTTGAKTVLYDFKGGGDGALPVGTLINVGGTLYGTTLEGGHQRGTVFSLNPATGVETVLHAFKGHADGRAPEASLLYLHQKLYGTTDEGGPGICGSVGCGTIFVLRP